MVTQFLKYFTKSQIVSGKGSDCRGLQYMGSPFQSQFMILQKAINNWCTLCDNFSDLLICPICYHYKVCTFLRHFYDNKKKANFL